MLKNYNVDIVDSDVLLLTIELWDKSHSPQTTPKKINKWSVLFYLIIIPEMGPIWTWLWIRWFSV